MLYMNLKHYQYLNSKEFHDYEFYIENLYARKYKSPLP